MTARFTADNFLVGLLKGLREQGVASVNSRTRRLDEAWWAAYERLRDLAEERLDLRFFVVLDAHGKSSLLRDAIQRSAHRDEIGLQNPEFVRFILKGDRLDAIPWDDLGLPKDSFVELASVFLHVYEHGTEYQALPERRVERV